MESPCSTLAETLPRRYVNVPKAHAHPSIFFVKKTHMISLYTVPPQNGYYPLIYQDRLHNISLTHNSGRDLDGNTYWEFRQRGEDSGRWRRIVKYPSAAHYSDVRVPPLWHQWLRYTRQHPPSIEEQTAELRRQEQMKILAARADARWAAKPRLVGASEAEKSAEAQISSPLQTKDLSGGQQQGPPPGEAAMASGDSVPKAKDSRSRAAGPGEEWQPSAWRPSGEGAKKGSS
jgi:NADH dehydrogenase [ubiquinone] 1 alpha subcomplex assembly factor 2